MGVVRLRSAVVGLVLSFVSAVSALAAPTISSFTPASGTIGTVITINGTGFTSVTAVLFNGVNAASYTVVSSTQINAKVPNVASTGPLKVTAGGTTATSASNFTVNAGMGLAPVLGPPTAAVTLYGAAFHPLHAVDVYFDTLNVALVVPASNGTISLGYQIPAGAQPGQHWLTLVERTTGLSVQTAFTVQTNWLSNGFGPRGAGVNPFENTLNTGNVGNLTAAWSGNSGGFSNPAPFVVASGSVFLVDANEEVRAYSKTGALMWTAPLSGIVFPVQNSPVAALGRVFVADENGYVYSYSQTCRSDGGVCTPQWVQLMPNTVHAGLTFYNGTLYVPCDDGTLQTLNPTTGAIGTPYYVADTSSGGVTTPVSFDADHSSAYGTGSHLHLQRGTSGSPLDWSYAGPISSIALNSGSAFFTSNDGQLHGFGSYFWDVSISASGCLAAPVVAYGAVYAGGCSSLGAYNPKTGATIWSISTGAISGLSEANGVLYACENNSVVARDVYYGGYLWTGPGCTVAPEIVNGMVYSTFVDITVNSLKNILGGVARPRASMLTPDYRIQPQASGTVIVPQP